MKRTVLFTFVLALALAPASGCVLRSGPVLRKSNKSNRGHHYGQHKSNKGHGKSNKHHGKSNKHGH